MDEAKIEFEEIKAIYNWEKIHMNARMETMKEWMERQGQEPNEEPASPSKDDSLEVITKTIPLDDYNRMLGEMVAHRETTSGLKLEIKKL